MPEPTKHEIKDNRGIFGWKSDIDKVVQEFSPQAYNLSKENDPKSQKLVAAIDMIVSSSKERIERNSLTALRNGLIFGIMTLPNTMGLMNSDFVGHYFEQINNPATSALLKSIGILVPTLASATLISVSESLKLGLPAVIQRELRANLTKLYKKD